MKKTRLSIAITFAVSSLIASNVSAQSTETVDESMEIESIVITARKRDESIIDVPVSMTVFTSQDIEEAGIETPSDFIALTPNVTLVQTQNAGNSFITARGISQNRNSEMSVSVLVDGVLMNQPGQFNQELIDIAQIEVLKGPQGALYGRNAIGGAITITTKKPTDELEGMVLVGADSGPGARFQAGISGPFGDSETLKYRASFSYKDTDGYIDNPFLGEKADPYKDVSGRVRLLWEASDRFTADARLSFSNLETQGFYYNIRSPLPEPFEDAPISLGHGDGDPNSVNDTSLPIRVNNPGIDDRDLFNLALKMDYEFDSGTLTSITSYDTLEETITGDAFDFIPIPESIGVAFGFTDSNQSQYFDVETVSQEFRFVSNADQRLRWIAGTYFVATEKFVSTGNMVDTGGGVFPVYRSPRGAFPYDFANDPINPQVTYLADSQDNFAWAVFGELAYDVSEAFELSFSLRYDEDTRENTTITPTAFIPVVEGIPTGSTGDVRKETWDAWQPKLTLRYKASDTSSYYASYSSGFRSGGFNQTGVGAVAVQAGISGVGDTFDAETVDTYEVGYKGQYMGGRINTSAALFHTVSEGAYFFVFLAENSTQNLGNLNEVEYTGFEFDVSASVSEYFDVNFGLGYTDSEITDSERIEDIGDKAPNVSEVTVNLGAQYQRPISLFSINGLEGFVRGQYQHIGETAFFDLQQDDTNDRDPVNLLDLRVGLEVVGDWSLTAWAKNLTDEQYNAEYSTGGFVFKALPRRYGIDFVKRF